MEKQDNIDKMLPISGTKKVKTIIDKLSFAKIFLLWLFVVLIFGLMYHFLGSRNSYLEYGKGTAAVNSLPDSIYFSFITATSTGFGDIVPVGIFKIIAILEVVCGLLLLAFVTSKLVSIKQDVLVREIYELSFSERLNRLRLSLLGFRQNITRIINNIEEGASRKREIWDIHVYIASLEHILNELIDLLRRAANSSAYTKEIDAQDLELICSSVLQSFDKLDEILRIMAEKRLDWKNPITIKLINSCSALLSQLYSEIKASASVAGKWNMFNPEKKEAVLASIKKKLSE